MIQQVNTNAQVDDDDFIKYFDALKYSGWGSSRLYRSALLGDIRVKSTHGRALMYSRSDIDRLMRQAGRRTASAT